MYFEKPGIENTEKTIELAIKTAAERNIKYIVFATTTGYTADMIPDGTGLNFVCVTHSYGTKAPGENHMPREKFEEIKLRNIEICTASHIFSGVERAISNKFKGAGEAEIMAASLKLFCEGMKVVVEISAMAADGGYIPVNEPVIAIAGTGRGADTAVILRASHASRIFDTKIDEIICKPLK